MEAVPRLYMLCCEFKSSPVSPDFGSTLKKYIHSHYHENPDTYDKEIKDLEILRQTAMKVPRDFTGCSVLKRYYAQLCLLQNRFPMTNDGPATVIFTWAHLYSEGAFKNGDVKLEQACILYNIGALHSQLGAFDTRSDSDGMKMACTHFQCAAWAFQHLRENFPQPKNSDMSRDIIMFMINIMLAQAQECILEKSMLDNRKSLITAKVAAQVVEYYKSALTLLTCNQMQSSPNAICDMVGSKLFKNWKKYIDFKMSYYTSISHFYMGNQSEDQEKMGERVAWYQSAVDKLNEAIKQSKTLDREELNESLTFLVDVIGGKHSASKKENDFVYHEKVPPIDNLPEIKGASLVKGIPFDPSDPDVCGPDIFSSLVPMEAHSHSSVYSEEKAELLRGVLARVEEKDDQIASFLSSLHLDKDVIPVVDEVLPQELVEKCAALSVRPTAIPDSLKLMKELTDISKNVEDILKSCSTLLAEEEEKEAKHQELFGKQITSMIVVELKKEFSKLEEAHNKASESNKALQAATTAHIDNLKLLSGPIDDMQKQLPTVCDIKAPDAAQARGEYIKLLNKVDEMREQRTLLVQQLRDALHSDDITKRLVAVDDKTDVEKMFEKELRKHDRCLTYLYQNLTAQDNILEALIETNARFADIRKLAATIKQRRDASIASLIASCETYEDLMEKAKKGLEFYEKLKTNVSRLFDRIKSVTKVQDEERTQRAAAQRRRSPSVPDLQPSIPRPAGAKLKDYLPYLASQRAPAHVPVAPAPATLNTVNNFIPSAAQTNQPLNTPQLPYSTPAQISSAQPSLYQTPQAYSMCVNSVNTLPITSSQQYVPQVPESSANYQPTSLQGHTYPNNSTYYSSQVAASHGSVYNPNQPSSMSYSTSTPYIQTPAAPVANHMQPNIHSYSSPANVQQGVVPSVATAQPPVNYTSYTTASTVNYTSYTTASTVNYASYTTASTVNYASYTTTSNMPLSTINSNLANNTPSLSYGQVYQNQAPYASQNFEANSVYQNYIPSSTSVLGQTNYSTTSCPTTFNSPYYQSAGNSHLSSVSTSNTFETYSYGSSIPHAYVQAVPQYPYPYQLADHNYATAAYPTAQTFNASPYSQFPGNNSTVAPLNNASQVNSVPAVPSNTNPDSNQFQELPKKTGYFAANITQQFQPHGSLMERTPEISQVPLEPKPVTFQETEMPTPDIQHDLTSPNESIIKAEVPKPKIEQVDSSDSVLSQKTSFTNGENKDHSQDILEVKVGEINIPIIKKISQEEQKKDPFADVSTRTKFVMEVEKFDKLVEGLVRKSLNGTTPLDQHWKDITDLQEKESRKMSISVARCYPLKNRVPEIMPYDNNRVKLTSSKDDYINASYLKDLLPGSPAFIITQSPLPSTYSDFWLMVWEQQVETVVCLLPTSEMKNHIYWPKEKGQTMTIGIFDLTVQSMKESSCFVQRIVNITNNKNKMSRVVVHLQFTAWPLSKLANTIELLRFVSEVLSYYTQQRSLLRPVVVHCSAGVGRSGIFCLISSVVSEMNNGHGPKDIAHVALRMSLQRKYIIQDKEHLKFCYDCVLCYAQNLLKKKGILTSRPSFEEKTPSALSSTPCSHDSMAKLESDIASMTLLDELQIFPQEDKRTPPNLVTAYSENNRQTNGDTKTEDPKTIQSDTLHLRETPAPEGVQTAPDSDDFRNFTEKTLNDPKDTAELQPPYNESDGTIPSVTSILDPNKFTLKLSDLPAKKKITKDMFVKPSGILSTMSTDTNDPLSTLDPLWSLKKDNK